MQRRRKEKGIALTLGIPSRYTNYPCESCTHAPYHNAVGGGNTSCNYYTSPRVAEDSAAARGSLSEGVCPESTRKNSP